jgi:hypothetical protein
MSRPPGRRGSAGNRPRTSKGRGRGSSSGGGGGTPSKAGCFIVAAPAVGALAAFFWGVTR